MTIMIDVRKRIASDKCKTELDAFAQTIGLTSHHFKPAVLKGRPAYEAPRGMLIRDVINAGASVVACAEIEKRAVSC
jgi:hypothetical protein